MALLESVRAAADGALDSAGSPPAVGQVRGIPVHQPVPVAVPDADSVHLPAPDWASYTRSVGVESLYWQALVVVHAAD